MIPKRVSERIVRSLGKYQQILKNARDRDVNESNTVFIIRDMLADVFGYDGHLEITSEFAVKSTFCDLAVKVDGKVEYMIEAKAIGLSLKDNHLRQAVDYGARNGVPWVILTNGMLWQLYKIRFEQPVTYDLVCSFDVCELAPRNPDDQEKLLLICKEGIARDVREEYHERVLALNRYTLGALILGDEVVGVVRRELRKLSGGILVDPQDIRRVLVHEVLKRDVVDGEEAGKAQAKVKKLNCKPAKTHRQKPSAAPSEDTCQEAEPEVTPSREPQSPLDPTEP